MGYIVDPILTHKRAISKQSSLPIVHIVVTQMSECFALANSHIFNDLPSLSLKVMVSRVGG